MELATSDPVLVTGGTGFLASYVIQQLLVRGYRVRATVRSASAATACYSCFSSIPSVHERLEVVEADLLKDDRWEDVFDGVKFVVHLAALPHEVVNTASMLCATIIDGTKRILVHCSKSKVTKFVYVSCLSALSDEFESSREYSEADWNELSSLDRNVYAYCKTAAERLVLDFASTADRCSVVSIVPGVMWGPALANQYSFSYRHLTLFLSGYLKVIVNLHYNISDVRDVANACVLALVQERISGRYIVAHKALSLQDILSVVHEEFPDIVLPVTKKSDAIVRFAAFADGKTFRSEFIRYNIGRICHLHNTKALGAGMMMRPPIQTIKETVQYLLEQDWFDLDKVSAKMASTTNAGTGCVLC